MSIRDLGFIKWKDEFANYENRNSTEFINGVKEEEARYDDKLNTIDKERQNRWAQAFSDLPTKYEVLYSFKWLTYTFDVRPENAYCNTLETASHSFNKVQDYGTTDDLLWLITDNSNEREDLSLFIYDKNLNCIKEIQKVGDTAVSFSNDIYFVGAEKTFWFNKIYRLSGKEKKLIYSESEEKYVLSLKSDGASVFIIRKSAVFQDIGILINDSLMWIEQGYGTKIPIDKDSIAFNQYFSRNSKIIKYPEGLFLEDLFSIKGAHFFIFTHGVYNSLYRYNDRWIQIMEPTVCNIKYLQEHSILLSYPNKPSVIMNLHKDQLIEKKQLEGPHFDLSHSIEPVPWFLVSDKKRETKGLVVCGYGSYGMSMRKSQQRLWIPWLKNGYSIAFVCTRGGRENGDEWWDESRTSSNRINGVLDFATAVKYLQEKFHFTNKNTIIYGRSAGGFLVTAVSQYLINDVAVIYAAKPYTDVLRTTSNKNASQTLQEADEFGLADNPVDFIEITKISPQETIIDKPMKNPTVLLTGGFLDPEVPFYMPLKYAKALQKAGWSNVYVRLEKDEGHFTRPTREFREAQDAAICDSFIEAS